MRLLLLRGMPEALMACRWGEVIVGRPLKFGEHLRLVGFKETEQKIERMDKRADSLGMKRSDYLRWLVDKDLAAADVA